ncbi:hypothetical protein Pmani_013978 [Petrolisthes manimaculis]|uniref:Uncharacterized protein n=1 Tax=Petrolisthes manimaculis TaxID=1843537 RepID=A0AAE1UBK3_9EUCA|nr:hypothetical protein Pmani_013978 [Petrolisthes manimaculis]
MHVNGARKEAVTWLSLMVGGTSLGNRYYNYFLQHHPPGIKVCGWARVTHSRKDIGSGCLVHLYLTTFPGEEDNPTVMVVPPTAWKLFTKKM